MTGLIIKSANGDVLVDMTKPLSQNLGYIDTNAVNGSGVLPNPPFGKTLFYSAVSLVNTNMAKGKLPGITIGAATSTGTPISWVYSYNTLAWGNFSANTRIYYGYY